MSEVCPVPVRSIRPTTSFPIGKFLLMRSIKPWGEGDQAH